PPKEEISHFVRNDSLCHSEAEGEESPSYGWSWRRVSLLHLEENPRHFVPRIDNSLVYFWGSIEGAFCCPLKILRFLTSFEMTAFLRSIEETLQYNDKMTVFSHFKK
ncbi:hypothetical protein, partial [Caldisericum sp.]|uniref:hypothetical protein n=1 Tax=Caldisericum sp. TaxID=2499687 RepID=UPI003D0CBE5D